MDLHLQSGFERRLRGIGSTRPTRRNQADCGAPNGPSDSPALGRRQKLPVALAGELEMNRRVQEHRAPPSEWCRHDDEREEAEGTATRRLLRCGRSASKMPVSGPVLAPDLPERRE